MGSMNKPSKQQRSAENVPKRSPGEFVVSKVQSLGEKRLRRLTKRAERLIERYTAKGERRETLREASAYCEAITNTLHESVVVLNASLRVVSANRSFYSAFGVNKEESIGLSIYELENRMLDIPELHRALESMVALNIPCENLEVSCKVNGKQMVMLLNGRMLPEMDRIVLAIEDITVQKEAEEELTTVREAIDYYAAEVEECREMLKNLMEHTS
jgi:PAS domain S-box-containing protein